MAERKMRYAVLTHFEKTQKIGNKARYQWDADNLLESYSYDQIKEVMEYFFSVSKEPTWTKFVYGFDDYKSAMLDRRNDRLRRKRNLEKVKEWLK